jgi:hypothetical protein
VDEALGQIEVSDGIPPAERREHSCEEDRAEAPAGRRGALSECEQFGQLALVVGCPEQLRYVPSFKRWAEIAGAAVVARENPMRLDGLTSSSATLIVGAAASSARQSWRWWDCAQRPGSVSRPWRSRGQAARRPIPATAPHCGQRW